MEDSFARVEDLAAHVREYVNNRIDSVKLSAAEKSSKLMANMIAKMAVLLIFVFFIVFASIALAYGLAKLTGEFYWGFLMVAGAYLLLGWIVWLLKEKIIRLPMMNAMLKQLFKDDETDDHN
jgi:Putative Actinobacterial Holin-X, holin superfamily III